MQVPELPVRPSDCLEQGGLFGTGSWEGRSYRGRWNVRRKLGEMGVLSGSGVVKEHEAALSV